MTAQELPAGACDCHVHVVGDVATYPMVLERQYTPAPAPHEALQGHLQRNGLQRAVLIQPSFYGTDNRCLLDSLARLNGAGRGVAVIAEGSDAQALSALHDAGVRGLRVNVESAGMRDPALVQEMLQRWARRLAPWGWHLQLYAAHTTIAQLARVLGSLPVPTVLDHFAMLPAETRLDDPTASSIIELVGKGNAYIKLSAPYRIAGEDAIAASAPLARAFIEAHPGRVLWGSDWPHTNREPGKQALEVSRYRDITPGSLTDSMFQWLPTPALREQVLVENPARLYGF